MKSKIHVLKNTIINSESKKIFFMVALLATAFVQQSIAQGNIKNQPYQLLNSYLSLKDALVVSNANTAAASASAFVNTLNETDKEIVKNESRNALLSAAVAISQTKDLKVQREKFAALSTNMFVLVKTIKLSTELVYQQYWPMKDASWISINMTMKNPYYGSAMLTCGSIKEIVQ